jgi:hypothetical protein
MIESMATVRITEAELARDVRAVLEKVERGSEVIIEREDHRPLAVMRRPQPAGRMISEVIADLKTRGSDAIMDDDFAHNIEEGIKAHRQPWNPPSWE